MKRCIRYIPASASSVFPAAIETEVKIMVGVSNALPARNTVRLAVKAPMKIPGHIRFPNIRINANAKPDGGHTGEAFVFSYASNSPSLALKK